MIQQLTDAAAATDHTAYHKAAHALKGAALNLHLPALIDVSRKAELLGKQLEITPTHQELLDMRQLMIQHLLGEYDRLDECMPEMRQQAEQEAGGGGDGDGQDYQDGDYNSSGNGQGYSQEQSQQNGQYQQQ
jgi:HPt (histidine-containing phosphotransfer) domain-containing protein